MQAQWRFDGLYKADAQKVADEIGERKITPEEVLEIARNENSELHKCFEWDDTVAAEKYRLMQARKIIVNLVYTPKNKEEQPVRCFQITSETRTYQPTKCFVVQQDEYQTLLKRAKSELESFRQRYKTLTELESIFEEIDKII